MIREGRDPRADVPGLAALDTLSRVLRHWRLLLVFPACIGGLTAGVTMLLPFRYTAYATFVPSDRGPGRLPAALAGLAGRLGVTPASYGTESSEFYAALLASRIVTDQVLSGQYQIPGESGLVTLDLVTFLEVSGDDGDDRMEMARRAMRDIVTIASDRQTRIVQISVELEDPHMAAAVANRYLEVLNDFDLRVRATSSSARSRFLERRLEETRQRMTAAEDALEEFHERNAQFADSPPLTIQEARLRRDVSLMEQLFASLAQEYELARVAEANNTPVITVLDSAAVPARRSAPRRTLLVSAAGALAGAMALALAILQVKSEQLAHEHPDAARTLRSIVQDVWDDLPSFSGKSTRRADGGVRRSRV